MAAPAYFHHPSSLAHDTAAHPERPARIPAIETELERRGWLGFERREAPAAPREAVLAVHPASHVEAIAALSARGGGAIDSDTVLSAGSYDAALHAAGGAVAMTDALLGEPDGPRVAFCGLRPPGHHAEAARAMGFCLFNNVAVAAQRALDAHGRRRVMVVDWDVHHGNGTEAIFAATDEVLYVSIHQSPLYPGTGAARDTGHGAGEGYTINLPVPAGSADELYASLAEHVIAPVGRAYAPELLLVSAGYDAHRDDPLADCCVSEHGYASMTATLRRLADELGVALGFVLEGGYDLDALARSVAATLEVAGANSCARAPDADSTPPAADAERAPPAPDAQLPDPATPLHPLAKTAAARLAPRWPLLERVSAG